MKEKKYTVVLLIINAIFLGFIVFLLLKKPEPKTVPDVILKNTEVLDSVNKIGRTINRLEDKINGFEREKETIIKLREPIINNYYNEIREIDNANDSMQYAILIRLLTRYDTIKTD